MTARNVYLNQLEDAAYVAGVRLQGVNIRKNGRITFRLALGKPGQWQRISTNKWHTKTRKLGAVCWHGHREFFRAAFALNPKAEFQTCHTRNRSFRWYTSANFETVHEDTVDGFNCPESACLCH